MYVGRDRPLLLLLLLSYRKIKWLGVPAGDSSCWENIFIHTGQRETERKSHHGFNKVMILLVLQFFAEARVEAFVHSFVHSFILFFHTLLRRLIEKFIFMTTHEANRPHTHTHTRARTHTLGCYAVN